MAYQLVLQTTDISIHALRKESDPSMPSAMLMHGISIHALRKESDFFHLQTTRIAAQFQSTLSVRRATPASRPVRSRRVFQSTLSVRRATLADSINPPKT